MLLKARRNRAFHPQASPPGWQRAKEKNMPREGGRKGPASETRCNPPSRWIHGFSFVGRNVQGVVREAGVLLKG